MKIATSLRLVRLAVVLTAVGATTSRLGLELVYLMHERFRRFASKTADVLGSSWAFLCALAILVIWVIVGPAYHYSATWQLVVNTVTSIVTFLMVFLIQNTQNRDVRAIQLKLDELLRAVQEARTELVSLEERPDSELLELKQEFQSLHRELEVPTPRKETSR